MLEYKYKIYINPVTVNSAYPMNKKGIRFLSPVGKAYKSMIKECMFVEDLQKERQKIKVEFYELELTFFWPKYANNHTKISIYSKNGKLKKMDPSNFIKILEDAIFEYLEVDDTYNVFVSARKKIAIDCYPYIEILIREGQLC